MELGDQTAGERPERSPLGLAIDTLNNALNGLIDTIETGGLEQLTAAGKVTFWQDFENFRNRLPLIDHSLVADAEATDLPGHYCFSNLTQFLVRILQLSHGDAASRVRAAAAVGPRTSMLGERLEPLLPQLAALQREGAITSEKVAIVERAMQKLSRPGLDPEAVQTAERLLTNHAPLLAPKDLQRFAVSVVDAADPDGPEPIEDQLQQDRRHLELKQRRDGMWWLQGKLTNTVGTQLNVILDPLAKPRSTELEVDGVTQRLLMNGLPGSACTTPWMRPAGSC